MGLKDFFKKVKKSVKNFVQAKKNVRSYGNDNSDLVAVATVAPATSPVVAVKDAPPRPANQAKNNPAILEEIRNINSLQGSVTSQSIEAIRASHDLAKKINKELPDHNDGFYH